LTVVAKLFNIVLPDVAVFGQKDAQQLRVIEQMVADLNFPLRVVPGPIVREADGLAMSSRNKYLSVAQRKEALCLRRALDAAEALYGEGESDAVRIKQAMRDLIEPVTEAEIDYIELVDWTTLEPVARIEGTTLIALAVQVGPARLIDNALLKD
jgi:pantoate--beta-alanine ligase